MTRPSRSRTVEAIATRVATRLVDAADTGGASGGITALTGDVTASGSGSVAATIATGAVSTAKLGGDITTAGKALLDDANAAAQRTTLGLGTAATSNTGDFAAASHTHPASAVTDFAEAVDDRVAALLTAGTNITLTYNDGAGTLTIDASGGGSGLTHPQVMARSYFLA